MFFQFLLILISSEKGGIKLDNKQPSNLFVYTPNKTDQYYKTINLTSLLDKRISFKAKGLHNYLMTRPKGWKLYMDQLFEISTDGKDSTRSGIKELVNLKYLHLFDIRDDKKRIVEWRYVVCSIPTEKEDICIEPDSGFPEVGLPDLENPPYSYKKDSKKKRERGETSSPQPVLKKRLHSKYKEFSKKILSEQKNKYPNFIKDNDFEKRLDKSAIVLEQLERIDGFNFESEIKPVIEWAIRNSFWSSQIKSLAAMRDISKNGEKKFVNIYSQYEENKHKKEEEHIEEEISLDLFSKNLNRQREFSI